MLYFIEATVFGTILGLILFRLVKDRLDKVEYRNFRIAEIIDRTLNHLIPWFIVLWVVVRAVFGSFWFLDMFFLMAAVVFIWNGDS